jgi:hypothetical protein
MTKKTFWLVLLLVLSGNLARAGEAAKVELLEGPIKDRSWDFSQAQVVETFEEQAFALTLAPTKYSSRGVALDRSSPFVLRVTQTLELPAGEYRLLMRSRGASRLYLDNRLLVELDFMKVGINGHESVPESMPPLEAGLRYPIPGQREKRATLKLDGQKHEFRWEVIVGGQKIRPEVGEPVVAIAAAGKAFQILSGQPGIPFSEDGWKAFARESRTKLRVRDAQTRFNVTVEERKYWDQRHEQARQYWKQQPAVSVPEGHAGMPINNTIDRFLARKLAEAGKEPAPLLDDDAFLRRVTLDTLGIIPSPEDLALCRQDRSEQRRANLIERMLADPRWADHWISYWQDVLAENPGLLKPTLNNTGPFRWWLYQALSDNLPMDRFVTELAMMEGSEREGAPAGFAVASENDLPMAAKAQILARAFLAADLTCARCHDSPNSRLFRQEQLFSMAAMLDKKALAVPSTSTVKFVEGARKPAIQVSLKPGDKVAPAWKLHELAAPNMDKELVRNPQDSREQVAAILTSYRNERFAQVLVNRVWKRFMGVGLVEPVDDWRRAKASHPDLLAWLGRELVTHDYDLKHIARLILNSHAYQRQVRPLAKETLAEAQLFASPARRRLSAEQVVDSLFTASGLDFACEELNFDPECRMGIKQCLNLGAPTRSWQFAGLANERDRPALALPKAQTFVDVLMAYGWRDSRTSSQTVREEEPTPLQPLILANGLLHRRTARLSDDSALTALALEEIELPDLIRRVYERILTRAPSVEERAMFHELLAPGFKERRTGLPALVKTVKRSTVSWSNHLSPEATKLKLEQEMEVRAGDPPTPRLTASWRTRMEDMIWCLMNSPEFVFVP